MGSYHPPSGFLLELPLLLLAPRFAMANSRPLRNLSITLSAAEPCWKHDQGGVTDGVLLTPPFRFGCVAHVAFRPPRFFFFLLQALPDNFGVCLRNLRTLGLAGGAFSHLICTVIVPAAAATFPPTLNEPRSAIFARVAALFLPRPLSHS